MPNYIASENTERFFGTRVDDVIYGNDGNYYIAPSRVDVFEGGSINFAASSYIQPDFNF